MRRRVWFQVKEEQQLKKKKKRWFCIFIFFNYMTKFKFKINFWVEIFKKKKYFFKKSAQ